MNSRGHQNDPRDLSLRSRAGEFQPSPTQAPAPNPPSPRTARLMLLVAGFGWVCGIAFLVAMVVLRFRTESL